MRLGCSGLSGVSATSGDCAARQTCSSLRFSFSFLSMFRPHESLLIRVMCLHVSPLLYNEKKTFVVSDSSITMKKTYLFLCKCVQIVVMNFWIGCIRIILKFNQTEFE
jgi:hypothetical protein